MVYKIDKINRRILYELDKNCRISDSQLAKKVGRSRESVRNRILKLQGDDILQGFYASINLSKFGYIFFKMYFQLANDPSERERFYDYLKRLPNTYWFGGNDGVWDLHGTFYAKTIEAINRVKNAVYTEFKHLIIKRDVGVLIIVRQHVKKYLCDEIPERPPPAIFAGEILQHEVSDLDKRLLSTIYQSGRMSLVELAKSVDSSVDIVRNRLKKMKEQDIIMQYRVAVNHSKLGYEVYKAFIYFRDWSDTDERRLIEYANQHTRIMYFIRQLSTWDMEIEIMAEDYVEFRRIMKQILQEFPNLIKNYDFVLMREDIWYFDKGTLFP